MTSHTNRAALYTVLNRHGEVEERGCTVAEAAITVMGYDSNTFEIRTADDGEGFELWTSVSPNFRRSGAPILVKSVVFSLAKDRASAEAQIYREVLKRRYVDGLRCDARRRLRLDAGWVGRRMRRGKGVDMKPSYKAAIFWIVANDDIAFLDDDEPTLSVTGAFVADLFDKDDEKVVNDLRKEQKRQLLERIGN